ncbi:hypothetical protein BC832DRAFT_588219 [Gaertneriomyces semiglobifer]|nr:hypothetical protein BC832DRAFT_588219 [Gaertneriomyces semiglobifer]
MTTAYGSASSATHRTNYQLGVKLVDAVSHLITTSWTKQTANFADFASIYHSLPFAEIYSLCPPKLPNKPLEDHPVRRIVDALICSVLSWIRPPQQFHQILAVLYALYQIYFSQPVVDSVPPVKIRLNAEQYGALTTAYRACAKTGVLDAVYMFNRLNDPSESAFHLVAVWSCPLLEHLQIQTIPSEVLVREIREYLERRTPHFPEPQRQQLNHLMDAYESQMRQVYPKENNARRLPFSADTVKNALRELDTRVYQSHPKK